MVNYTLVGMICGGAACFIAGVSEMALRAPVGLVESPDYGTALLLYGLAVAPSGILLGFVVGSDLQRERNSNTQTLDSDL